MNGCPPLLLLSWRQDRFSDLANLSRGSTIGRRDDCQSTISKERTLKQRGFAFMRAVYVRTCWSRLLCPGHFHHSTVLAWDSSRFLLCCTRISSLYITWEFSPLFSLHFLDHCNQNNFLRIFWICCEQSEQWRHLRKDAFMKRPKYNEK